MYEQNVEWINTLEESVVGIVIQICILLSIIVERGFGTRMFANTHWYSTTANDLNLICI